MNDAIKTILLWLVIGVILIAVLSSMGQKRETENVMPYSELVKNVQEGNIKSITVTEQNVTGHLKDNATFNSYLPMAQDESLLNTMISKDIDTKFI